MPTDGTGFSTTPFDQPAPAPDLFWPKLTSTCQWLTPEIAKAAGGTGKLVPTEAGCDAHLPGTTDVVQIAAAGPYDYLNDTVRFSRPITIAGLQARERSFKEQGKGECAVDADTRSYTTLTLVVWNAVKPDSGDATKRCAVGRRFMEVIVKKFVPLAGGTPWSRTLQKPGPNAGADKTACDIAGEGVAAYGSMDTTSGFRETNPTR